MRFDKLRSLRSQPIRQMLAVGPVLQPGITIRRKILLTAVGPAARPAALINVKALLLGPKAFAPKMPLARKESRVPGLLQSLCNRNLFERKLMNILRRIQFPPPTADKIIRQI